jgi:hypothetical protein
MARLESTESIHRIYRDNIGMRILCQGKVA